MERDFRETLDSQKKMLNHRGQEATLTDDEMQQQFQAHLSLMKPWLVRQPNIEVLYVNYNALMTAPQPFCEKIAQFLGLPLNQAQMLAVPDQQLYRNRSRSEK